MGTTTLEPNEIAATAAAFQKAWDAVNVEHGVLRAEADAAKAERDKHRRYSDDWNAADYIYIDRMAAAWGASRCLGAIHRAQYPPAEVPA